MPIFSDFLVRTVTVHEGEPQGMFLFTFKIPQSGSDYNIDVVLTPVSLYMLGGGDMNFQPELYKFGQTWYGAACGLKDLLSNFGDLVDESIVHKSLTPVGPLVQNSGSTFINKLTTVTRGPSIPKDLRTREGFIALRLPSDAYISLESETGVGNQARHLRSVVYVALIYGVQGNNATMGIYFIKSSWAFQDVIMSLRSYFANIIRDRMLKPNNVTVINSLTSAVICRLGTCSDTCTETQTSLHFKGSTLKTVDFSDFTVDPHSWKIIL